MLRGGMIENNLVVGIPANDSPRHFWGISANGNTPRLHRGVESSILSSSTKICPTPLQQCTCRLSNVPLLVASLTQMMRSIVTDAGGLATPHCGNVDEPMMPREICRLTERTLAIRESLCGVKRVEGVELHYNYRQQGEASNFARLTQR